MTDLIVITFITKDAHYFGECEDIEESAQSDLDTNFNDLVRKTTIRTIILGKMVIGIKKEISSNFFGYLSIRRR